MREIAESKRHYSIISPSQEVQDFNSVDMLLCNAEPFSAAWESQIVQFDSGFAAKISDKTTRQDWQFQVAAVGLGVGSFLAESGEYTLIYSREGDTALRRFIVASIERSERHGLQGYMYTVRVTFTTPFFQNLTIEGDVTMSVTTSVDVPPLVTAGEDDVLIYIGYHTRAYIGTGWGQYPGEACFISLVDADTVVVTNYPKLTNSYNILRNYAVRVGGSSGTVSIFKIETHVAAIGEADTVKIIAATASSGTVIDVSSGGVTMIDPSDGWMAFYAGQASPAGGNTFTVMLVHDSQFAIYLRGVYRTATAVAAVALNGRLIGGIAPQATSSGADRRELDVGAYRKSDGTISIRNLSTELISSAGTSNVISAVMGQYTTTVRYGAIALCDASTLTSYSVVNGNLITDIIPVDEQLLITTSMKSGKDIEILAHGASGNYKIMMSPTASTTADKVDDVAAYELVIYPNVYMNLSAGACELIVSVDVPISEDIYIDADATTTLETAYTISGITLSPNAQNITISSDSGVLSITGVMNGSDVIITSGIFGFAVMQGDIDITSYVDSTTDWLGYFHGGNNHVEISGGGVIEEIVVRVTKELS